MLRRFFASQTNNGTFFKFPLLKETQLAIQRSGIAVPTKAQELVIPKLLLGKSVLFFAPTGEGKALGYCIPLVNRLIESNADRSYPKSYRPRLLVLVPTRELAEQTLKTFRRFPVQSTALCAGLSYTKELEALGAGADVVIGTPARLLLHISKGNLSLKETQSLVMDEADVLCEELYEGEMSELMKMIFGKRSAARSVPQICVVSATRTGAINEFVKKHLPSVPEAVVADSTHLPVKSLEQVFVPIGSRDKAALVNEILKERGFTAGKKTMVFTESIKCCDWLAKSLSESGHHAIPFHSALPSNERKKAFADFRKSDNDVLVATGIASRGLDISGVGHVVLFDFPKTTADFLHKVGRTARGGAVGRVTALFRNKNIQMVKKLQEIAKNAESIVHVRSPGKVLSRILQLNKFDKALKGLRGRKVVGKRREIAVLRKRYGLPKRDWLGTAEKKLAMKAWHLKKKEAKEVAFLRKRRRLVGRKGEKLQIPVFPKAAVESTDSQTFDVPVQVENGSLIIQQKRRSWRKMETKADKDSQIDLGRGPFRSRKFNMEM